MSRAMKYNIGGKWEVLYEVDGVAQLIGTYSSKRRAEKSADKVMDRVAYGKIYIKSPTTHYEYWPTYKGRKVEATA